LTNLVGLRWEMRGVRQRILLVVGSPLHGVVDFSGCHLLRKLVELLVHFSLGLKEYGVIFCAMVGFTVVEHAIRRSEYVWALTAAMAMIWCGASLVVLSKPLIEGY
jgi:hypothetical protein